jgi:hypothetical protein
MADENPFRNDAQHPCDHIPIFSWDFINSIEQDY